MAGFAFGVRFSNSRDRCNSLLVLLSTGHFLHGACKTSIILSFSSLFLCGLAVLHACFSVWFFFVMPFMHDLPYRLLGKIMYSDCKNQGNHYQDHPNKLSVKYMISHSDREERSEGSWRPSSRA